MDKRTEQYYFESLQNLEACINALRYINGELVGKLETELRALRSYYASMREKP